MYVKVMAEPGAKKEKIEQLTKDHFVIAVKAKAEKNAANIRVLEVLADFLVVSKSKLKIITGHHSRSKIISVED